MVAFEEQLAPTASGQHLIIGLLLGAAFSILKFCVYLEFAWHWRYTRRACTRRLAFCLDNIYIELHTIDNLNHTSLMYSVPCLSIDVPVDL